MINPIFKGIIKQGKFLPDNLRAFSNYLCTKEGKPVECIIKIQSKQRSLAENNYYWGVVIAIISESSGNDEDTVHKALSEKFSPKEVVFGIETPISTSRLTTVQFEERLEKIRMFASEFLNCYIPLPRELDY